MIASTAPHESSRPICCAGLSDDFRRKDFFIFATQFYPNGFEPVKPNKAGETGEKRTE